MRIAVVVFAACLAGLGSGAAGAAFAAEAASSPSTVSIEVSGTGEVTLDPDRATVSIAVDTQGMTSAEAAADNAHRMTAVTRALLDAGAQRADLTTANYSVQPQWQYTPNAPPKRIGYQAQNTLRVSVRALAQLGPWIDRALGAGATRVENIDFESSQMDAARRKALAQAVANARADAQTLAEAAGGHLGALLDLSTLAPGGPRPLFRQLSAPGPAPRAVETTPIEPSPLEVTASVTGRWRFEP